VTGHISKRWADTADCATNVPIAPPEGGPSFELDAIDVGTGLSIFVRGPDFTLLYDAGSNDDRATGAKNRTAAFLAAVHPDVTAVTHVVLSHPHQDHVELLADIVRDHTIGDVWDSGAYNDICGYRAFLRAVADTGARYHTAKKDVGSETITLLPKAVCNEAGSNQITVQHGAHIGTNTPIPLGASASMRFLHVDGDKHSNFNDNSLVLRLELGTHVVMLMGDSEAGGRNNPSSAPTAKSVEGKLLTCCTNDLRADVLVVAHHGSMSSSRKALLEAVGAKMFLVSVGPFPYNGTVLPDQVVIDELSNRGTLFCTNLDDDSCRTSSTKIGAANDGEPGGCSNVRVTLSASGIDASYFPAPSAAPAACRGH
jgi:competence protein ComEC